MDYENAKNDIVSLGGKIDKHDSLLLKLLTTFSKFEENIKGILDAQNIIANKMNEVSRTYSEFNNRLKNIMTEHDNIMKSTKDARANSIREINEETQQQMKKIMDNALLNSKNSMSDFNKILQDEINKVEEKMNILRNRIIEINNENKKLESKLNDNENNIYKLNAGINNMKSNLDVYSKEIEDITNNTVMLVQNKGKAIINEINDIIEQHKKALDNYAGEMDKRHTSFLDKIKSYINGIRNNIKEK